MKLFMKVKIFFSVIPKNLNWEISTINLVTFKRCDRVNDKKYYGISLKNPIFWVRVGRGCMKKNFQGSGESPKKRG